ncbi:hypothetical protein CBR_g39785 [Chara braunii]|uniref:DUF4360 domain-containing protein n=1 Tax=Chara braunii TaxID=69332 RepID=A0A388LSI4_CHABU|nr:hypothetical protein CBR_g39785 [Chara braunii]|eukprot:GBG85219.1 hypothetical protein CBR_g39785 [Chara braunii]
MARSLFPAMVVTAALSVVTILSAVTPAFAGAPELTISSIIFAGSGCSYSDSTIALSPDYSSITLVFDNMIATTDAGSKGLRKFCQLSLSLDYPRGWSVTLGSVTGSGFLDIAKGSKGVYETQFYFSGQPGTPTITRTFPGPQTGNFKITDSFLTLVYSKCNVTPNLNIKLVVSVEGSKAVVGLNSSDLKFSLIFGLLWKNC